MALTDQQEKAAIALFGEEWFEKNLVEPGERRTKELEAAGVAHKGVETEEDAKAKKKPEDEEYEKPEEEEKQLDKFKKALKDIAGKVKDDDATAKAIRDVAGKLTEDNMEEHGRTLKMLAGKLEDDLKTRLGKIADAMTKGEGYPAPGPGYRYPAPKGEKGEPVEVELDLDALAEKMKSAFSADVTPLAEALAAVAVEIKGLAGRMDRLEQAEALKQEAELPRYTFKLVQRASEAEETAVKEEDPLRGMKPKETEPKTGSMAGHYFGH